MSRSEFLKTFNKIHRSDYETDNDFLIDLKKQAQPASFVNKYVKGVLAGIIFNVIAYAAIIYCISTNRISPVFFMMFRFLSMPAYCVTYYRLCVPEEDKHQETTYFKTGEHYETTVENNVVTTKKVEDYDSESDGFNLAVFVCADFFLHEIMLAVSFLRLTVGSVFRMLKCASDKEIDVYYILGMTKKRSDPAFGKDYRKALRAYDFQPDPLYDKAVKVLSEKEKESKLLANRNKLLIAQAEKYKETTPKKYEEILSRTKTPPAKAFFLFKGTGYWLSLKSTPSCVSLQDETTGQEQIFRLFKCDYYQSWIND